MLERKPIDALMDPNVKLLPGHREPLTDTERYHIFVVNSII